MPVQIQTGRSGSRLDQRRTSRSAHYNNVGPGSYRFHLLACNKDGVRNENGAALTILLRPHFWQTLWFRILALAAPVGLAGGSTRFVTQRKMQRKLELVERAHAIERERGRIAKDIHDDLVSSLTQRRRACAPKAIWPNAKKSAAT